MSKNVLQIILQKGRQILKGANIESADLDALILLEFVTKTPREKLIFDNQVNISEEQESQFFELIKKRATNYPIAKIINKKEFYGYCFHTSEHTLDPRPATEAMVDHIIRDFMIEKNLKKELRILDLGTGTGCIIISLINEFAKLNIKIDAIAVDISEKALEVAKKNAKKHLVYDKIKFIQSNWFKALDEEELDVFDIIVANAPYVKTSSLYVNKDAKYDPKLALYSGEEGLDAYKKILKDLPYFIDENTNCYFEMEREQIEKLKQEYIEIYQFIEEGF